VSAGPCKVLTCTCMAYAENERGSCTCGHLPAAHELEQPHVYPRPWPDTGDAVELTTAGMEGAAGWIVSTWRRAGDYSRSSSGRVDESMATVELEDGNGTVHVPMTELERLGRPLRHHRGPR
jgi:hypothetical protein